MLVITGATLVGADGWHEDGWCWPETRFSLRILQPAKELRVGLWLKPEPDGAGQTLFTISVGGGETTARFIEIGRTSELVTSVDLQTGDLVDLRLTTPHRASRGDDLRNLSFILTSLELG